MNKPNFPILAEVYDHFWSATKSWEMPPIARAWYRGHTDSTWLLLPTIFRNGNEKHEFLLTKRFRLLAPGYGVEIPTNRLDQWLFLMQHHGAPTRLLDWTESLDMSLFFACKDWIHTRDLDQCSDGAIFALDPIFLNQKTLQESDFPVTWSQNPVFQTIKFAFGTQDEVVFGPDCQPRKIPYLETPVAILPSTIHSRIKAQKACFTLHGKDKRDLESIFSSQGWQESGRLIKYKIEKSLKPRLTEELANAGVTYAVVFPDLDGLANDLKYQFNIIF